MSDDGGRFAERLVRAESLIESHEHYDRLAHDSLAQRVEDIREGIRLALTASERADEKASAALEKRLDGVNEFRLQLSDQAASFASKDYIDSRLDANARRITVIENFQSKILGAIAVAVVLIPLFSGIFYYEIGSSRQQPHPQGTTVTVTTPAP